MKGLDIFIWLLLLLILCGNSVFGTILILIVIGLYIAQANQNKKQLEIKKHDDLVEAIKSLKDGEKE